MQYEALQSGTGKPVPELQVGECPSELLYVWEMFISILKGCDGKINYSEICNYCELFKCQLAGFEIEIILELDRLRRTVLNG